MADDAVREKIKKQKLKEDKVVKEQLDEKVIYIQFPFLLITFCS